MQCVHMCIPVHLRDACLKENMMLVSCKDGRERGGLQEKPIMDDMHETYVPLEQSKQRFIKKINGTHNSSKVWKQF